MTFPDYKAKSLTFKNTMVFFLRKRLYLFTQAQRCTADSTPHPPAIEGLEVFTFDATSTDDSLLEHKNRLLFKIHAGSALHKVVMLLNQPGMDMHQSSHNWYYVQELLLDVYSSLASARSK